MKPIAFVVPWYGEDIPGGAETLCREVVGHLYKSGVDIEVLTTCVKEFKSDWNQNYYKEGVYYVNDVLVRRFSIRKRNVSAFDYVNFKLMNNIKINNEEEKIFFEEMINSESLYKYIFDNKDNYHCFVFLPYMFGTTYWGIKKCKENSILIPCFHDESYAYLNQIKEMTESVKGIIFNAKPELDFANQNYNIKNIKTDIIGLGLDENNFVNSDAQRFKKKFNINNKFILYAGRKDSGKNIDELISYFTKYKFETKNSLKLVLIGGGNVNLDSEQKEYIIDLGYLQAEDKYDAYAAADIFCNPSKNESFSIVVMESWLAGTSVVVNGYCEVTKNFCLESSAGLYYENYYEFKECIELILNDDKLSKKMGQNGINYVRNNFTWDIVTEKYRKFFENI